MESLSGRVAEMLVYGEMTTGAEPLLLTTQAPNAALGSSVDSPSMNSRVS